MNDPTSNLLAPPPRYLLESDSSDEEGQGTYPSLSGSSSKPKLRTKQGYQVEIDAPALSEQGERGEEIVIALGQAGRYLHRSISGHTKTADVNETRGTIKVNEKAVGSSVTTATGEQQGGGIKVWAVEELDLDGDAVWEVVRVLTEHSRAKKWTIITSYVPSMYIPSVAEQQRGISQKWQSPPIRVISSANSASSSGVSGSAGFDSPNYLTGIAGALISLAAHPASPLNGNDTTATVILLPLPLSSLSTRSLTESLSNISPTVANAITQSQSQVQSRRSQRASWTEDDDEPFSAPGMGRKNYVGRGDGTGAGAGETMGMYT